MEWLRWLCEKKTDIPVRMIEDGFYFDTVLNVFYSNFHLITKCAFIWCTGVYYTNLPNFLPWHLKQYSSQKPNILPAFFGNCFKNVAKMPIFPKNSPLEMPNFLTPPPGMAKKTQPQKPAQKKPVKNPQKAGFLGFFWK